MGREIQEWELMYTHGGFMLMYGKTNIVKLKKNKIKKPNIQKMKKKVYFILKTSFTKDTLH